MGCSLLPLLMGPAGVGGVERVATLPRRITTRAAIVLIAVCALGRVSVPASGQSPERTTIVITATVTDSSGSTSAAEIELTVVRRLRGTTLRSAKSLPDGAVVHVTDLVTTTSDSDFDGVFYAQHADRSSGIGILWNGSVSRGEVVSVVGALITLHGERFIQAQLVDTSPTSP